MPRGTSKPGLPLVPHPCSLVSSAQASAAAHASLIAASEAPLGPTCIFRFDGRAELITLTVDRASIQKLAAHMQARRVVNVAGRPGYCGRLGGPVLYLALAGGSTLSLTGPCGIDEALAFRALQKLRL